MDKRGIGNDREEMVSSYLRKNGVRILDRNFLTKHGEIDIVGLCEGYLVFFEVKYRNTIRNGYPLEAVTYSKQRSIIQSARVYMYLKHFSTETPVRFDCIGVLNSRIEWIKNAFEAF